TLVWAALALPETRPPVISSDPGRRLWRESRELLTTPAFAGYVLCAAMISGPFYSIMGGGPHVVMTLMGRSATEFGLWLVFASVGYMGGNFLAGWLSVRHGGTAMLWWGLFLEFFATLASAVHVTVVPDAGPAALFVPLFVVYVGNGMALPNAIAGAISVRPNTAGTASGVTGCVQIAWGPAISHPIPYPLPHPPRHAPSSAPFAWIIFAQAAAGLLFFWLLVRPEKPMP